MSENSKTGFIGAGNMAEAIARGLVSSKTASASSIYLHDIREEHLEVLCAKTGMIKAASIEQLASECDVIILAVKPQNLADLAPALKGILTQNKLAISIMAGITSQKIERSFIHPNNMTPRVVRAMPNTPALVGKGVTAISAGTNASDSDLEIASKIFESVGIVEVVDESMMDAVTGLTGSGPAYIFKMMESLITAGIQQGLPKDSVPGMVKALVAGAAELALQSDVEPDELRRRVTSPGGTTEAGLAAMDSMNFEMAVIAAVTSATKRSLQLAEEQ